MATTFTTRSLELLKPHHEEYTVTDPKTPGLTLRVWPSGQKRWTYRYTNSGRQIRKTLGPFPRISVEQARAMVQGFEHTDRIDLTYDAVFKVYVAERNLRDTTIKDYIQKYKAYIEPTFGQVPVSSITREDVEKFYAKLVKRSPAQANYSARVMRAVINFAAAKYRNAEGRKIIVENPVQILSDTQTWRKLGRRKNLLRAEQIKKFWGYWEAQDNLLAKRYHQLLLLTGMRGTALLTLMRSQIHDQGVTFLNKNGDDLFLPFSDLAWGFVQEVLDSHRTKWVFPGPDRRSSLSEHFMRLHRTSSMEAIGADYTRHDLRRTFMTLADEIGVSQSMLKRLAGHRTQDVTEGYIITSSNTLLRATNQISEAMQNICQTP
jgi:site-specific recombinase XerD